MIKYPKKDMVVTFSYCGWLQTSGHDPAARGGQPGRQRSVWEVWGCGLYHLGLAGLGSCNLRGTSRGLHSGAGGDWPRLMGLGVVGVRLSLGGVGVSLGVGLYVAAVCGLPGVGGGESLIVQPVCGVSGGGEYPVAGSEAVRACGHWVGSGKGAAGDVGRGSLVVCPCSCPLAVVCMCGPV